MKNIILLLVCFLTMSFAISQVYDFDYYIVVDKDKPNKNYGVATKKGEIIIDYQFDYIGLFNDGLSVVKIGDKCGYIDFTGNYLVTPKYDMAFDFYNGFSLVSLATDRFTEKYYYGFIDTNGNEIIPCSLDYNYIYGFESDYAIVFKGSLTKSGQPLIGKYGLINKKGDEVVKCIYDDIELTSQKGFVKVFIGELNQKGELGKGKTGLINSNGDLIIPIEYDEIYVNNGSSATAYLINKKSKNKEVLICLYDLNGNVIIPLTSKYHDIGNFSNNRIYVSNGSKYGYIDPNSNLVIDFKYDYGTDFSSNKAIVREKNKWCIIDTMGKILRDINSDFDICKKFDENNLALTFKGKVKSGKPIKGKYGLINIDGNDVSDCQYDTIYSFVDDLAIVRSNKKYGFIDKTGKEIIPIQYDFAFPLSDGLACVKKDGFYGFIDKSNQVVIQFKYYYAHPFINGIAKVFSEKGKQFLNTSGNVLF